MRNEVLTRVALRYKALFININRCDIDMTSEATAPVIAFVARLRENGFCVSEELLHALCAADAGTLCHITDIINDVMGVNLNWAPLVKGWNVPTGESYVDHLITFVANLFGEELELKGTRLGCGHIIPDGTFPLERYNGCPFCGTPFRTTNYVFKGQTSKLKELRLFTEEDMLRVFNSLLTSTTPLDATQRASLQQLLTAFEVPDSVNIGMKETIMIVIKQLFAEEKAAKAQKYFKTPTDILRYLWYEKTGKIQIIEPKTLIAHAGRLYYHMFGPLNQSEKAADGMRRSLKLKYDRTECQKIATLMNQLPMSAMEAAEMMHPKRGMWVRFIRALRLGEYSRRKGYKHLAQILDVFYKQNYTTWQGELDRQKREQNVDEVMNMLKQRPGMFARCLFSTMLRFGRDVTLNAFNEVADQIPARLLLSLINTAEIYFDADCHRQARPITGVTHLLKPNPLLSLYDINERKLMISETREIFKKQMSKRFSNIANTNSKMYIDPVLFDNPIGVGDRSMTVQDISGALMGTRFHVEGSKVRLFLQWGRGLHAQHLDMDLSCRISYETGKIEECAYYNLTATGAKHSGDIRSIPEMVGTAEYIELDLDELDSAKAKYVTFTCNAYSCGALSPNLVVGWMDSANPMKLSEEDGVAYDPSCVHHMVRVGDENIAKGLVFGVLTIETREITWLEMPYTSQTIRGCEAFAVDAFLRKLREKTSIGELLKIKAEAQGIELTDDIDEADEKYTSDWALNTAEVNSLLGL